MNILTRLLDYITKRIDRWKYENRMKRSRWGIPKK